MHGHTNIKSKMLGTWTYEIMEKVSLKNLVADFTLSSKWKFMRILVTAVRVCSECFAERNCDVPASTFLYGTSSCTLYDLKHSDNSVTVVKGY